jgi:hypothetical protein
MNEHGTPVASTSVPVVSTLTPVTAPCLTSTPVITTCTQPPSDIAGSSPDVVACTLYAPSLVAMTVETPAEGQGNSEKADQGIPERALAWQPQKV